MAGGFIYWLAFLLNQQMQGAATVGLQGGSTEAAEVLGYSHAKGEATGPEL